MSAISKVQKLREQQLIGKAEFARKAGVSESTLDRVEAGLGCRLERPKSRICSTWFSIGAAISTFRFFPLSG